MSERLSEIDWLQHGLQALAEAGFASLKAEPLAKSLGVSRGSFYWHFDNLADFHGQLLDYWQETTTEAVIRELERDSAGGKRLEDLMLRAFNANSRGRRKLEAAIRHWAQVDADVDRRLREVDAMRIDYLTILLSAAGATTATARTRARFVYAASLGDSQIGAGAAPSFTRASIRRLAAFLQC